MKINLSVFIFLLFLFNSAFSINKDKEYFINIIFTGNENAIFEPCNCPGNPAGGMARKVTMLNEIRRTEENILVINVGDFLSRVGNKLQNEYSKKLVKLMKFDFVIPGNQEFIMGKDFFVSLKDVSRMICSNLKTDDKKIKKIINKYEIKKIGNIRVGIIGILEKNTFTYPYLPEGIELLDPVETCKECVSELKDKTDIILVGLHGNESTVELIAKEVPDVTVIIAGHHYKYMTRPDKIGETFILWPSSGGKSIGKFKLKLDSNKRVNGYENTYIELDKKVQDDKTARKLIDEYNELLKQENQNLLMERRRQK